MESHRDLVTLPATTEPALEPAIVALAFPTPRDARQALDAARALATAGALAVHDAVLVFRPTNARATVHETRDPTPLEAAVPSSVIGAVIGAVIGGPIGLIAGAALGAGGGALGAALIDTGIPDEVVIQLREITAPGEFVLALLVGDIHGPQVIDVLRRFRGARVVYATLPGAALDLVRRTLTPPAASRPTA